MNGRIAEYFPLNFFGADLVPGIGRFMAPVTIASTSTFGILGTWGVGRGCILGGWGM